MAKNIVKYKLTDKDTFLTTIQASIGGTFLDEHTLHFPTDHPVMSGTFYRYNIEEGVRLFICTNIQIKNPIIVERVSDDDNDFLLTHIYLSDTPLLQEVGNETKTIMRLDGGVYHNSSSISFLQHLAVNQNFSFLATICHRQWLKELLNPQQDEFMHGVLHSNKPLAFYDSLSREWQSLAESICNNVKVNNTLDKLEFNNKVMNLVFKILRKLSERKTKSPIIAVNRHDLNAFMGVRQTLLDNFVNPPTISQLAKQAAMSESKLKAGFKQTFGDSIYQYVLRHKLEMGYALLYGGEKTVKEVSYELGYTNPSHFAEKFKEHFNYLPSQLIKEAK